MRLAAMAVLLLTTSGTAQAFEWQLVEWRLGVAYASGLSDVTDLYEDNLRLAGFDVNVDLKVPVGIAAGATYSWASGMRADVGLGPVFLIGGDIKHLEVPLAGTVGYNFARAAQVSPYIRAGLIHHFVDGDLYSSSTPGLFAAVGLDFTHFSLEVAVDRSEVEFDSLACVRDAAAPCNLATTELNTYDVLAAFSWRFR